MSLNEDTPLIHPVRFRDVVAYIPRLGDVLLHAQSYLACFPDSIPVCTNEHSLAEFHELEEHFISGYVAGDPPVALPLVRDSRPLAVSVRCLLERVNGKSLLVPQWLQKGIMPPKDIEQSTSKN